MFVNDEEVGAHKTHGTEQEVTTDWDRRTFFGRALTNMKDERYMYMKISRVDKHHSRNPTGVHFLNL